MSGLPEERRRPLLQIVRKARKDLEEAFADRLRLYGFFAECSREHRDHVRDCFVVPAGRLHLGEGDQHVRNQLETVLEREAVGFPDLMPSAQAQRSVERYIYEASATLFNRLAALRALEVRGLVEETVVHRPEFGGRSRREYLGAR